MLENAIGCEDAEVKDADGNAADWTEEVIGRGTDGNCLQGSRSDVLSDAF